MTMAPKKFKVWITKYALTRGVFAALAEDTEYEGMVRLPGHPPDYVHKPHWHTSEKQALEHVADMVTRKLKAMKKQMLRYEQIRQEALLAVARMENPLQEYETPHDDPA